jgi:hypothetical protein
LRVRPCRHLAAKAQLDVGLGSIQRIWFQYKGCRRSGILDIGNRQSRAYEYERPAPALLSHNRKDIADLLDESMFPPNECFPGHRANRLLGRSFPEFSMHKLFT